ncbi:hypothetical protein MATR_21350 [Marivirga tractuosa]|uniref:Uncharacterized protein n=1 Tax=Marivirga tractuosa (strain ATCC 23168 / DSM 4126 / NBRC 15989 / NCIMB 1408 / VKM B-1430 / H-43) TaxID=643867 RepID=E4TLB1_MARTH|nr:hypothetical protein [Marivirga tractuosa]ADR20249.1 hypothetical protein Ftrac_0238 [Marivirga tractuosa DSM 4126]BDD15310.1 hypothetical protein MATR_21350 [Marivirga tractuosa]
MSIRERILLYLDFKNQSIRSYEKINGFGNGSIGKYLKGEQKTMGLDKLEKMLIIDSYLSAEWLLRGEGEMFIKEDLKVISDKPIDFTLSFTLVDGKISVRNLKREIDNLKSILDKHNLS